MYDVVAFAPRRYGYVFAGYVVVPTPASSVDLSTDPVALRKMGILRVDDQMFAVQQFVSDELPAVAAMIDQVLNERVITYIRSLN